jgi:membrane-associated phospholipid phosphatase
VYNNDVQFVNVRHTIRSLAVDSILQAGIVFILWFQSLGAWLEAPMKFFTFLGSEEFFLFILPVVYWCIDTPTGIRMGVVLLLTGGINDVLKLAFHGPRPYWVTTQVKALSAETSFGVPSGHAQIASGLWGILAARLQRFWAWGVALFLILMIGLSRLYLAVHFPHDVLIGWVFGLLILWAILRWWGAVAAWVRNKTLGQQIGLAFMGSVLVLTAGSIAFGALRNWNLPPEWLANAQAAGVEELPAPVTLHSTITSSAALFGLLAGLAWIQTRGGYSAGGPIWTRTVCFLLGLVGVLVLWYGLGLVFPRDEAVIPYILRYLRYALVGGWISAGAPWLFTRLKLVQAPAR